MGAGVIKGGKGGGRRGRRRRGQSAAMSEINVTPFVDVMLVLLIIFMVAAPLLTVGVPIELPETAARSLPTEQEEPLAITMAADGRVFIQTTEVTDETLIPRLQAIAAEYGPLRNDRRRPRPEELAARLRELEAEQMRWKVTFK